MVDFVLYILKINLLTAIGICLVYVLSKVVKGKYSSWWRYYMWLVFSVTLIIPFGLLQEAEVVSFEIPYQKVTYETSEDNLTVDSTSPEQAPSMSPVNEGKTKSWWQNLSALTLVDYADIFMYVWIGGIIVLSFIRILHYQISVYYLKR